MTFTIRQMLLCVLFAIRLWIFMNHVMLRTYAAWRLKAWRAEQDWKPDASD